MSSDAVEVARLKRKALFGLNEDKTPSLPRTSSHLTAGSSPVILSQGRTRVEVGQFHGRVLRRYLSDRLALKRLPRLHRAHAKGLYCREGAFASC
ncbi:MAG: hypothetical protein CM1200mP14_03970 [Gammaproteobacteria bacterium]|nr:MAG: hypothetical protein CM1200mP14_03970 [Gammaproteobacteria bacterium]